MVSKLAISPSEGKTSASLRTPAFDSQPFFCQPSALSPISYTCVVASRRVWNAIALLLSNYAMYVSLFTMPGQRNEIFILQTLMYYVFTLIKNMQTSKSKLFDSQLGDCMVCFICKPPKEIIDTINHTAQVASLIIYHRQ